MAALLGLVYFVVLRGGQGEKGMLSLTRSTGHEAGSSHTVAQGPGQGRPFLSVAPDSLVLSQQQQGGNC